MATKEIKISRFDGGMAEKQAGASNQMSMLENFDLGSTPEYLKPLVSLTANTAGFSTLWGVRKLVYAFGSIWGLGNVSVSNTWPKIYKLQNLLDATNSLWSQPSTAQATSGQTNNKFFRYYRDYLYFFRGTQVVGRYGPLSTGPLITETWATFSASVTINANAVVHESQDKMFIPFSYNNGTGSGIASVDSAGTFDEDAILLSPNMVIRQLVPMGEMLAIICSVSDNRKSILLLWDMNSEKVSENINLGTGDAYAGELVDGILIIYVLQGGVFGSPSRPPSIRVLGYSGGAPTQLFRIKPQSGSGAYTKIEINSEAVAYNGNTYVGINYTREGQTTFCNGILRVGRKDRNAPLSYSIDYNIVADTAGLGVVDLAFYNENIVAINPLTSTTSNSYISNYQPSYISTSIYESITLDGGDSSQLKELVGISIAYNPIVSSEQIVCKIRKDEETSWTTVFTETTANSSSHKSVNYEPTGDNFQQFRSMEIRLESTGGAQITGVKLKYNEILETY